MISSLRVQQVYVLALSRLLIRSKMSLYPKKSVPLTKGVSLYQYPKFIYMYTYMLCTKRFVVISVVIVWKTTLNLLKRFKRDWLRRLFEKNIWERSFEKDHLRKIIWEKSFEKNHLRKIISEKSFEKNRLRRIIWERSFEKRKRKRNIW